MVRVTRGTHLGLGALAERGITTATVWGLNPIEATQAKKWRHWCKMLSMRPSSKWKLYIYVYI